MTNRIIVDQDKCTGCNICSKICPIGVVDPADENHLPEVKEAKASSCMNCGHCEVFCPSGALTLNFALHEKDARTIDPVEISPEQLEYHLKEQALGTIFHVPECRKGEDRTDSGYCPLCSNGHERPAGRVDGCI